MTIEALLKKVYVNYYVKIFSSYETELEKAIGKCKTLLDVGCGNDSPIKSFSKKFYSVGVDIFKPSIEKSKNLKIHNKYYKINVLDIGKKFKPNSFDCVLASDLIEHLSKEDGIVFTGEYADPEYNFERPFIFIYKTDKKNN